MNTKVEINKILWSDYLLMFLFLCMCGNPVFVYLDFEYTYVLYAVVLFTVCICKRKRIYNTKFLSWLLLFCFLFTLQYVSLDIVSIPADINFMARLYTAFLISSFFGLLFREVYFNVIVAISAISIVGFIFNGVLNINIGYEFERYRSILVYNQYIQMGESIRNSGMFWEPGAFQGFIMMVPVLFSNKLEYLWKYRKKSCIILILAFISTKSTAAYMTMAVYLVLRLMISSRVSNLYKVVIISLFSLVLVYFVWGLDFMGEKIMAQLEDAKNVQQGDVSWDRFGAMRVDIYNIIRNPFIGNGFNQVSKYGILAEYMSGAGNGLSSATNMLGIPCMILYFVGIYNNFSNYKSSLRIVILVVVSMLLFNEAFLNYSLFWALLFIRIPRDYEKNSSIINSL
ncbi:MAG: hypothetical protein IJ280_00800 [Bacteroidales bacterium]|nr:hypothetical protein [Bacteroidales bacterium]